MKSLFSIAWGLLVVAWAAFVVVMGEFKFGCYHGTPITPANHFGVFWAVAVGAAALGSAFIITGAIGTRRELLDLDRRGDKYDSYD